MSVKDDGTMGWEKIVASVNLLALMGTTEGRRLAQLREARGWSQEDLSHQSGVSVKTISRFENGRGRPIRGTVRNLATALGVDERLFLLTTGPNIEEAQLDRVERKIDLLLAQFPSIANHP